MSIAARIVHRHMGCRWHGERSVHLPDDRRWFRRQPEDDCAAIRTFVLRWGFTPCKSCCPSEMHKPLDSKGRTSMIRSSLVWIGVSLFGLQAWADQWERVLADPNCTGTYCMICGIYAIGPNLLVSTGSGFFLSTDGGTSWSAKLPDPRGGYSLTAAGSRVFAPSVNGVFVSSDSGRTWNKTGAQPAGFPSHVLMSAPRQVGDTILLAGLYHGVSRSTNYGASWTYASAGLPTDFRGDYQWVQCLLAVGSVVYSGCGTFGIYRTTNDGDSWTNVGNPGTGLTNLAVGGLEVIGTDIFAATQGGVAKSTNDGAHWQMVNTGLSNTRPLCMTTHGTNLFVGGVDGKVDVSTDLGESWTPVGDGLPTEELHAIAVGHDGGGEAYLFAGTLYSGVWRRRLSEIVAVGEEGGTVPSRTELRQNFPNPFNAGTVIGYRVSGTGSSKVRLVVYDVLGREVAVLLDEQKPAGTYQVEFDGSNLSSGVYIYRLSAGDYVESKRMILLR
jgi:hypothetical protein